MLISFKFNFGDIVKHKRLGFKGYVCGFDAWETGCHRVGIQQPIKKDGTVPDLYWAEEMFLELVKAAPEPERVRRAASEVVPGESFQKGGLSPYNKTDMGAK